MILLVPGLVPLVECGSCLIVGLVNSESVTAHLMGRNLPDDGNSNQLIIFSLNTVSGWASCCNIMNTLFQEKEEPRLDSGSTMGHGGLLLYAAMSVVPYIYTCLREDSHTESSLFGREIRLAT